MISVAVHAFATQGVTERVTASRFLHAHAKSVSPQPTVAAAAEKHGIFGILAVSSVFVYCKGWERRCLTAHAGMSAIVYTAATEVRLKAIAAIENLILTLLFCRWLVFVELEDD